jgi:hypothetical protein
MSPNRSSAVMQQRHEALDSLDDFPTPPFSTRSLCERLSLDIETQTVWESAANRGFMVRPLAERFGRVIGSDIHDYGAGFPLHDFAGGALGTRGKSIDASCAHPEVERGLIGVRWRKPKIVEARHSLEPVLEFYERRIHSRGLH